MKRLKLKLDAKIRRRMFYYCRYRSCSSGIFRNFEKYYFNYSHTNFVFKVFNNSRDDKMVLEWRPDSHKSLRKESLCLLIQIWKDLEKITTKTRKKNRKSH